MRPGCCFAPAGMSKRTATTSGSPFEDAEGEPQRLPIPDWYRRTQPYARGTPQAHRDRHPDRARRGSRRGRRGRVSAESRRAPGRRRGRVPRPQRRRAVAAAPRPGARRSAGSSGTSRTGRTRPSPSTRRIPRSSRRDCGRRDPARGRCSTRPRWSDVHPSNSRPRVGGPVVVTAAGASRDAVRCRPVASRTRPRWSRQPCGRDPSGRHLRRPADLPGLGRRGIRPPRARRDADATRSVRSAHPHHGRDEQRVLRDPWPAAAQRRVSPLGHRGRR